MEDGEELRRNYVGRSVQLEADQWRWLRERSHRNFSASISAELRRLVGDAMKAEQEAMAA